jgi:hypothetical protein
MVLYLPRTTFKLVCFLCAFAVYGKALETLGLSIPALHRSGSSKLGSVVTSKNISADHSLQFN